MTDEEKQAEELKLADAAAREKNDEGQMIPKARLDQVLNQKKEAEAELKAVADSLLEDVPEEFKDVVPDLPPGKLIQWLRNASRKGLFVKPSTESLDTKRANKDEPKDLSGLTPTSMMSMGYGKK